MQGFELPPWEGDDQVDASPYQMTISDKQVVARMVEHLPKLQAIDTDRERTVDPYPPIIQELEEFFQLAAKLIPVINYRRYPINSWLQQPDFLDRAQFPQLQIVLVWMTRGERFCDGFWTVELRNGNLVRLLIRLAALLD